MLPVNQFVLLTKVSQQNAGPLPEVYWLKGHLAAPLAVGAPIYVARTERCGREPGEPEVVKCLGDYSSSPVVEMVEEADGSVLCQTLNSHWRVTPLPEPT